MGAQQDTGEQFYKFKVGTTWEYDQIDPDGKSRSIVTVSKVEDAKVTLDSKDYRGEEKEPFKTDVTILSAKDGFLWIGGAEEGGMPPLPIYKFGSKKGDTWKHKLGEGEQSIEAEVSHLGTEEVQVPAGTFKDTTVVEVNLGEMGTLKISLAPNVGMIRFEMGEMMKLELTKFQPAK